MEPSHNTAEKELLKAIEGKADISKKIPSKNPQLDAIEPVKKAFEIFGEKLGFIQAHGGGASTLTSINRILWGVIGLLLLIYFGILISGIERLNNVPDFKSNLAEIKKAIDKGISLPLKEYTFYIDTLVNRNIFNPAEEQPKVAAQQFGITQIAEATKDLRVAGISWAEDPKQRYAMIEDGKTKVTYFLLEGDKILSCIVKAINKDKVILEYMGEEIELR